MQTWLPLLRTLWSSTIESSTLIYDILVSFFIAIVWIDYLLFWNILSKMLYAVLWSWLDFVVGQSDRLFWLKFRYFQGASEQLKKNIYGFRASRVQCFGCFCLENILVYSYLFLSADVKFMWRYFDFWHVLIFSFFLSQTLQVRTAQLEHRKINKLLLPHRYTLVVLTVILWESFLKFKILFLYLHILPLIYIVKNLCLVLL